jgi:hypothetical protein
VVRYPVDLRASINTDTLDQDVKPIGSGPSRVNTGIERDGGLTNLYRQDTAVTAGTFESITDAGKVLGRASNGGFSAITIDGVQIGQISDSGIKNSGIFSGVTDVAITAAGTLVTMLLISGGTSIRVTEIQTDGTILGTRDIGIVGANGADRGCIIRSAALDFAGNLEFVIMRGGIFEYWIENGLALAPFTMAGASLAIPPYVYKYENAGSYLVSSPADGLMAVGNLPAGPALVPFNGTYAVLQNRGGFSRHIITKPPALAAGLIQCVGLIGHTTFLAAFSAVPLWQTPGGMVATAVDSAYRLSYGGVEAFYTQGGLIRSMSAPEFNTQSLASYYVDRATGDNVPIDYYGLAANNNGGINAGQSLSIRLISIKGRMSHFSAVLGNGKTRGVIITPVGEIDITKTPDIFGTNDETHKILVYKYNGSFYYIEIDDLAAVPWLPQKIDRGIYKLNTLSLYNIVDTNKGVMLIGSDDYNGRMSYIGAAGTTRTLVSMKTETEVSGGVDVGERGLYSTMAPYPVAGESPAIYIGPWGQPEGGGIDHYSAGVYIKTWISNGLPLVGGGATYVDDGKGGTVYVPSTSVPLAIGGEYNDQATTLLNESYIRDQGMDLYILGNRIPGVYSFFRLFGNLYAYNEGVIYLVPLSASGFVQTLQPIATGQALQLIATAPTMIYFLSSWDNSLYSFDGGRALVKGVRMNQLPAIIKGEWNVAENSLTLDTASSFIFVRDGVVSSVAKNADQIAGVTLWSADDGVHIVGTANRYKFNYNAVGTVQPLAYRSAFFGLDATKQAYLSQAVFTVYSPARAQVVLKLIAEAFDMDDYFYQDEEITVYPGNYSAAGYFRARSQPGQMRGLGAAIGIECASKIVVLDAAVEVNETAPGTVAAKGSV